MSDEFKFWFVIMSASIVKLLMTKTQSVTQAIVSIVSAVFFAWVFTDPILNWLQWPAESYRNAIAAMLALIGDAVIRRLIDISKSPTAIADLINLIRGK